MPSKTGALERDAQLQLWVSRTNEIPTLRGFSIGKHPDHTMESTTVMLKRDVFPTWSPAQGSGTRSHFRLETHPEESPCPFGRDIRGISESPLAKKARPFLRVCQSARSSLPIRPGERSCDCGAAQPRVHPHRPYHTPLCRSGKSVALFEDSGRQPGKCVGAIHILCFANSSKKGVREAGKT